MCGPASLHLSLDAIDAVPCQYRALIPIATGNKTVTTKHDSVPLPMQLGVHLKKQESKMPKSITVAALTHDFLRKRSIVTLVWDDDPEKMIALPVLFGCGLDRVQSEAEKALRGLSAETAAITINSVIMQG